MLSFQAPGLHGGGGFVGVCATVFATAKAALRLLPLENVIPPCCYPPRCHFFLLSPCHDPQVCESPLLGYVIAATSSLSLSTRASAYSCLFHLLEALQEQEAKTAGLWTAASGGTGGSGGAAGFKARKAAEAAFRQRPQLTLLLR